MASNLVSADLRHKCGCTVDARVSSKPRPTGTKVTLSAMKTEMQFLALALMHVGSWDRHLATASFALPISRGSRVTAHAPQIDSLPAPLNLNRPSRAAIKFDARRGRGLAFLHRQISAELLFPIGVADVERPL
jgi:hypothetical protein